MYIKYYLFACPNGYIGEREIEIPDAEISVRGLAALKKNSNLALNVEVLGNSGKGFVSVTLTDDALSEDVFIEVVPATKADTVAALAKGIAAASEVGKDVTP